MRHPQMACFTPTPPMDAFIREWSCFTFSLRRRPGGGGQGGKGGGQRGEGQASQFGGFTTRGVLFPFKPERSSWWGGVNAQGAGATAAAGGAHLAPRQTAAAPRPRLGG